MIRLPSPPVLLLALTLAACGSVLPAGYRASDLPDPARLTEEWGCGQGFWLGDGEQTEALRIQYLGEGPPPQLSQLPSPDWEVRIIEGTDLYANWCDDVIEPDEPSPVEHWNLLVVGGELRVEGEVPEPFSGGELRFSAVDLKVELPDGSVVEWGDVSGANPSWGMMAG